MVLIILILIPIAVYLLYYLGLLPMSIKRAVTFIGTRGSSSLGASFTRCSGGIYQIVRFRESRSYSFQLSGRIQQGTVSVQILDAQRVPVLTLDAQHPSGIINAEAKKRYRLRIQFENASGDYQLEWS